MSLKGKPYIVTWSSIDNSLRLYRLNSSNVFVAVANSTLPVLSSRIDASFRLSFLNDLLLASFANTSSQETFQVRSLVDLAITAEDTSLFNNGTYNQRDRCISKRNNHIFYPTLVNSKQINADGTITALNLNPLNSSTNMVPSSILDRMLLSKDEKLALKVPNNNVQVYKSVLQTEETLVSGAYGNYEPSGLMMEGATTNDVLLTARISDDNRYLAVARHNNSDNSSRIHLVKIVSTSDILYSIASATTLVVTETDYKATAASFHPSSKFLAVGFTKNDGTAWLTKIYRREGDAFVLHQTLTGIGALLSFTADGKFLIDCATKKAYSVSLEELFTENLTMMANITAGSVRQAISDHSDIAGIGEVYNEGLARVVDGDIDFNNLYIMLLSKAARFNALHSTINAVTKDGLYEVTGLELAKGGIKLTNVRAEAVGTIRAAVKSDNAKQIIVANDKTFKFAVIYDKTSGVPLTWLDFIDVFTAVQGTELTIDLSTNGILNYYK